MKKQSIPLLLVLVALGCGESGPSDQPESKSDSGWDGGSGSGGATGSRAAQSTIVFGSAPPPPPAPPQAGDELILFDELLGGRKRYFSDNIAGLVQRIRSELGLPAPSQVGVVVPDVPDAVRSLKWHQGFPNFFVASQTLPMWIEDGVSKKFKGENGFTKYDGLDIELVSPGKGSNFYGKDIDPWGRPIVQHIGWTCPDVDACAADLESKGYPVKVRGKLDTGAGISADFVYLDTVAEFGFYVEIISWKLLGEPCPHLPIIFCPLGLIQFILPGGSWDLDCPNSN